jgi:hypothetical protein
MPFIKSGIATVGTIKCSCGQTLDSVFTACPKCGKNLRPFSNPDDKKKPAIKDKEPPDHSC